MSSFQFVSEWSQQIIYGLIIILLAVLKLFGTKSKNGKAEVFVTHPQMQECQKELIGAFSKMENRINTKIDDSNRQRREDVKDVQGRIDDIYKIIPKSN